MVITETSLKALITAAKRHCRSIGAFKYSDDFSQYLVMKIIEGKRPKVFQAWRNFISQERGQKNPKTGADSYKTRALNDMTYLDHPTIHGVWLLHDTIGIDNPTFEIEMDFKRLVMRHLELLTVERDHRLYWLHFFCENTNEEISQELTITVRAVKNAIYRITQKLRAAHRSYLDPIQNDPDPPDASTSHPKKEACGFR